MISVTEQQALKILNVESFIIPTHYLYLNFATKQELFDTVFYESLFIQLLMRETLNEKAWNNPHISPINQVLLHFEKFKLSTFRAQEIINEFLQMHALRVLLGVSDYMKIDQKWGAVQGQLGALLEAGIILREDKVVSFLENISAHREAQTIQGEISHLLECQRAASEKFLLEAQIRLESDLKSTAAHSETREAVKAKI